MEEQKDDESSKQSSQPKFRGNDPQIQLRSKNTLSKADKGNFNAAHNREGSIEGTEMNCIDFQPDIRPGK